MILPTFVTWTENGKEYTQVSADYKRALLADYAKRYELRTFVETGTCEGDTTAYLNSLGLFDILYTIEKVPALARAAKLRFASEPHIKPYQGDSYFILPNLLPLLNKPALFWLDAHADHWNGPVVKELQSIFATSLKGAILVDDMDYITDELPSDPRWSRTEEYGIVRFVNVG